MPTLSEEGVRLFLGAITIESRSSKSLRSFVWNLFHTDYDERLDQVIRESWNSSRALAAEFEAGEHFSKRLEAAVHALVKLMISNDKKKIKKSNIQKSVRFWVDVMKKAFETEDYQTTHLILRAISHPIIVSVNPKMQRWATELIKNIRLELGPPGYNKHVRYWANVRSDTPLPSLFAFNRFVQVRKWQSKYHDAKFALDMIEIFKYLEHGQTTPIYNQAPISNFNLQRLASKIT
jgi:hypothetical protein